MTNDNAQDIVRGVHRHAFVTSHIPDLYGNKFAVWSSNMGEAYVLGKGRIEEDAWENAARHILHLAERNPSLLAGTKQRNIPVETHEEVVRRLYPNAFCDNTRDTHGVISQIWSSKIGSAHLLGSGRTEEEAWGKARVYCEGLVPKGELAQRLGVNLNDENIEPIFVLRAQDLLAPALVREWARQFAVHEQARINGNSGYQKKYRSAMQIAEAMEKWPHRKMPD